MLNATAEAQVLGRGQMEADGNVVSLATRAALGILPERGRGWKA